MSEWGVGSIVFEVRTSPGDCEGKGGGLRGPRTHERCRGFPPYRGRGRGRVDLGRQRWTVSARIGRSFDDTDPGSCGTAVGERRGSWVLGSNRFP